MASRWLDLGDINIGHPEFDERAVIGGRDAEHVRAFFWEHDLADILDQLYDQIDPFEIEVRPVTSSRCHGRDSWYAVTARRSFFGARRAVRRRDARVKSRKLTDARYSTATMIHSVDWCALARLIRGGSFHRLLLCTSVLAVCLLPSAVLAEDEEDEPQVQIEPYGFARLDAVVLTHRMNHPQYSMWVRPGDVASSNPPNLTIYARLTRLGVDFDASEFSDTFDLKGKIEADFQNGGSESRPAPRLRHGYGKISTENAFGLAGQTWDLVSPLYPSAHADALMWNAGNLGDRRPQVRFGWTPGGAKLQGRVAAALGATGAVDGKDLDGNGRLDGLQSGIPMVQGLAEISTKYWGEERLDLGVSASWTREEFGQQPAGDGAMVDSPFGDEEVFHSYSLNAHVSVPLTTWWKVRGEGFYGANLSDVRGGIGQGLNRRTGEEIRSLGGWGEMIFTLADVYTVSLGASLDDVVEADLPTGDDVGPQRTQNRAAYLVQKVRPWKPVQIGLEYWYWKTQFVDRPTGTSHRFNLHTSLHF